MGEYLLEMKNITKNFLSMKALDKVDFRVKTSEIHGLLGINGAGKSTLIKVLSGIYKSNEGEIVFEGKKVFINSPNDAMGLGISTVYQEPHLIPSFTAYENIFLGTENKKRGMFKKLNRKVLLKNAKELIEKYSIDLELEKTVSEMNSVEKEIVAILKALSNNLKLLVLDEPTSILTEKEKEKLFKVIRMLKDNNVAIIYITHRLDEVNTICDRYTILRDGKLVATKSVSEGFDTMQIAELILGRKIETMYPPKNAEKPGETIFKVKGLCVHTKFSDININIRKGEILGIFGLYGSGIDEIAKALFGAIQKNDGKTFIKDEEIVITSPGDAIKNKIYLIPGDRHSEGLISELTIANNLTISNMKKVSRKAFGFLNMKLEAYEAKQLIEKLTIATSSYKKNVAQLSGGNQQKVVIGKGLFANADIYIFCEPTVGVDIGAKAKIYEIIRELSRTNGVIIISSDCEEICGLSDRVMGV